MLFHRLELFDEVAVAVREPADQRAHRRVRDEADRRAHGEQLGQREARVDDDSERVQGGRADSGGRAPVRPRRERDHRDREVEEVRDPDAGALDRKERDEDGRVENRRGEEQERAMSGDCRRHLP